MDLLKGKPKRLYHKYLLPSFASALMISIYSFVDTIAVGQYAGPSGYRRHRGGYAPVRYFLPFSPFCAGWAERCFLENPEAKEILRREMLTSLRP